ncbi:hypothetical protein M5K25_002951 [Dendrobium thyrsiflorum]|uniref:Uncharacterized protein n=1 Tax=Dendrobium thyrsiflorum TaxID=117978 RepID=A0ABD0VPX7_DENTH
MPMSSSQEPPFVGSSVYNDCNTKRTDEWPSKHNQAGRGAKRQSSSRMPKVGCKDYSSNSSSSNKSVIWARKEDDNTKGEAAGWPRWETVSNQNCEKYSRSSNAYVDDSAMACKKGWNESKCGNAKRVTGEGGDVIHHDGLDGWRQSNPNIHMVEKGSLSKSECWDRPADGNGKQETGGWSRWPGATSKATQQCTSHQNRKGCWNQSEEWTTSEDGSTRACKKDWNESRDGKQKREDGGDAFGHDGCDGWRQSSSNIHIVDKGSLSKSTSWDQVKDENFKQEIDECGRWPGAMSKTTRHYSSHKNREGCWNQSKGWAASEDGSTMACRSGWNAAGDGKETREITDGYDASEDDARDGFRQSSSSIHMAEKGSLSNSAAWDRAKDDNVKKENSGWPRWPEAMSKTIRQFPRQSWGWTSSDDGKLHKETDGWNRDLVQNDPWIHRGSVMPQKCDWNKSVTGSKGDSLDIDQKKWDPGLDQTGGDPWKQISPTVPPKTRRRKFVSATVAGGENSIIRKSKWSDAPDFSNPDALKQHRSRWCAAMAETSEQCTSSQNVKGCWNQSWGRIASEFGDSLMENNSRITDLDQSDDPRMEHRPMKSPKCDWNKSASWTESRVDRFDTKHKRWGPVFDQTCRDPWEQHIPPELPRFCRRKSGSLTLDEGKNSFKESNKFSGTTDFGDPETLKQLPKLGGESLFRGRSRAPYHAWEHENYRSNDTYKKGAVGVAAYSGDSPHPCRSKSSYPNDQRQRPPSNLKDEVQHHEQQQALLNGESFKKSENIRFTSNTQDLNVLPFSSTVCVSSSDPVFIQANVDPSYSNLCSGLSPAIIGQKSSTTSEELKTGSKKPEPVPTTVAPSEKILNTSTHSVKEEAKQIGRIGNLSRISVQTMNCPYSENRNTSLSEPVDVQVNGGSNSSKYEKEVVGANGEVKGGMDDKGIRMFKIALAEFVKEIIKPVWKEGRLSKAAHNTVVKKVVDKVVGVQGTNIPQTQERIDLYLSCAKGKLHKLVQDYLEMFINT